MLRAALALVLLSVALLQTAGPTAAEVVGFKLGFKVMADQIPWIVGQPLENEHWGANGDSLQRTTGGLLVWRKADNWTAFTNGSRTWVNGPYGIQERGNEERFEWEAPTPPPPPAPASPPVVSAELAAEEAALAMINLSRQQAGLGPLQLDAALQRAARGHARNMVALGFFGHESPDGRMPWDRAASEGASFGYLAENIGWSQGYPSPTEGVRANHTRMMAETPPNDSHRATILNSRASRIGIGVARTADGKVYFVSDFAG